MVKEKKSKNSKKNNEQIELLLVAGLWGFLGNYVMSFLWESTKNCKLLGWIALLFFLGVTYKLAKMIYK